MNNTEARSDQLGTFVDNIQDYMIPYNYLEESINYGIIPTQGPK